jgi:hypothetical protein
MKRPSTRIIPFRAARRSLLTLPIAMKDEIRIAQISGLPEFAIARAFRRAQWSELSLFQPEILIGYGFDLDRLAEKVASSQVSLKSVDRSIFALTDCGSNPITEAFRDRLWKVFGVPIYELIVVPGCHLLASECEAHDGWHLQPGTDAYQVNGEVVYDLPPVTYLHTGFTGEIETAPCGCGRPTHRLKNLSPVLPQPYNRQLAAIA